MGLFGVQKGVKLLSSTTEIDILCGEAVPSEGSGVSAPLGSIYFKTDGITYKKTGSADTEWKPYSEIEGGGLLWTTINSATTAEAGTGYVLDSSSATFTVTMPASPEIGDTVGFVGLGSIDTNTVSIAFNSLNMNGSPDDLVIDLAYCYFELIYSGDSSSGWVLSSTDESGNLVNVLNFIGSSDNADPGVTEFSQENFIVSGDSLESAIDKLDIALANSSTTASGLTADLTAIESQLATNTSNISDNTTNITTNSSGIAALESYVGSSGASSPDYDTNNYITDGDSLEDAVSKLDAAVSALAAIATTGVSWAAAVKATTADVVSTTAGAYSGSDAFSDDEVPFWTYASWVNGDRLLSTDSSTLGYIYTWDSSADAWVYTATLAAGEAVFTQYDFLDSDGTQEDGAAYMMSSDSTTITKIADFDLETAATINLSSTYAAVSGTTDSAYVQGTDYITSSDTVESAIAKLSGNSAVYAADIIALEVRVTNNEYSLADGAAAISNLNDAVGSATGLAGMTYTSTNYVTDGTSAVTAISALDSTIGTLATTVSGLDANLSDINSDIAELDNAHDALASVVLNEAITTVSASSTGTSIDTVTQTGSLGAKWFIIAYDGSGNRYACEVFAMHDGSTSADHTEYAILTLGTTLDIAFSVTADGTNMSLLVDNSETSSITVKTQRTNLYATVTDTTTSIVAV